MSKESEYVDAEYHVIRNPDNHIILIGVEEYPKETNFAEAIKYNHINNRNRLLFEFQHFC